MSLYEESAAYLDSAKQRLGENFGVLASGIEKVRKSGIAGRVPRVGEAAPDFTLPDFNGQAVSLSGLLQKGPVVVSFYRGEWCPFCNLELKAFEQILPEMEALGATFLAISPEKPNFGQLVAEKQQLTFPVLTDAGNAVAKSYHLVFEVDPGVKKMSKEMFKNDLATRNADGTWQLPIPATFVIDRTGILRFVHADPDYMLGRADPQAVLTCLREIAGKR